MSDERTSQPGTVTGQIGVDVGGTFTDVVYFDSTGRVIEAKVPSVPSKPGQSTLDGLDALTEKAGLTPEQIATVQHTHCSTIATNALIERTGADVGMIVNEGFGDVLEIQRLAVKNPLRFDAARPAPLIPRSRIREVPGRLNAAGEELEPLDEAALVQAAQELVDAGAVGVVVSFLHSYRHAAHEQRAKKLIEGRFPGLAIDISSAVWPQAREYERGVTAVLNSYVRPVIEQYLDRLGEGVTDRGFETPLRIGRSNGGMQQGRTMRERPVVALLSGPAAGVTGAAREADLAGWRDADLVTVDVGGTSADIGVVRGGQALLSADEHIADQPLLMPTVAVSAIGAGGGSILSVDATGSLRVGPRSVGADPGPACYGRQSTVAALTDAFVACGWMSANHPLGGRLRIDPARSEEALGLLAAELGADIKELSSGAIEIALSMMAAEATRVLARRGVDAPDFRLVAYGGAGPLIGVLLAEALQIERVLIPSVPGALSAMGAARANLEGDHIRPVYSQVKEIDDRTLPGLADALEAEMAAWLEEEADGLGEFATDVNWTAEMRYDGQGWDVEVPLERAWLATSDLVAIEREFHLAHNRLHGHANPANPVWLKEIRAHLRGSRPTPAFFDVNEETAAAPGGQCTIRLRGEDLEATVVQKHELAPGAVVKGPAIVRQMDTTTLIPPGWTAVLTKSQAFDVTRDTTNEPSKEQ